MNTNMNDSKAIVTEEEFYYHKLFEDMGPVTGKSFSKFLTDKQNELCGSKGAEEKISRDDIADMLNISRTSFSKIVSKERPTKYRDFVIAVCAVLQLETDDTNRALYAYGGMKLLSESDPRDMCIMDFLDTAHRSFDIIAELNKKLEKNGYHKLVINRNKGIDEPIKYPYKLIRKHFQCTIGGIRRYSTPEYFLDLLYDTDNFYNMRTCMEFDDKGKRYELCISYEEAAGSADCNLYKSGIIKRIYPPQKKYTVFEYPYKEKKPQTFTYYSIEDTQKFKNCFQAVEKAEEAEMQRRYDIFNDTRNYGKRTSAKVIENELHVFTEEYNCDIPEFSEYYLMDHCRGKYTLYISKNSKFMQMYLSKEKYEEIYGQAEDTVTGEYSSVSDIEASAYEEKDVGVYDSYGDNLVVEMRIKAYKRLKSRIQALERKLKEGNAHICNTEPLGKDAEALILAYLYADKAFECNKNGKSTKKSAEFTLSDGKKIELTVDDLIDGFRLGLQSPEETGCFLIKHGSLKIKDII